MAVKDEVLRTSLAMAAADDAWLERWARKHPVDAQAVVEGTLPRVQEAFGGCASGVGASGRWGWGLSERMLKQLAWRRAYEDVHARGFERVLPSDDPALDAYYVEIASTVPSWSGADAATLRRREEARARREAREAERRKDVARAEESEDDEEETMQPLWMTSELRVETTRTHSAGARLASQSALLPEAVLVPEPRKVERPAPSATLSLRQQAALEAAIERRQQGMRFPVGTVLAARGGDEEVKAAEEAPYYGVVGGEGAPRDIRGASRPPLHDSGVARGDGMAAGEVGRG